MVIVDIIEIIGTIIAGFIAVFAPIIISDSNLECVDKINKFEARLRSGFSKLKRKGDLQR